MSLKTSMTLKTRIHDGIIGAMVVTGVLLGLSQGSAWLNATIALGGLMVSSSFTAFCPVYFVLDRVMRDDRSAAVRV